MPGVNEWNVAAGMTQELLTSLITAGFDNAVASGKITNPITIVVSNQPVTVELSHPDLQIVPDPAPDTSWANSVDLGCDLETETDPPLSGRLSVQWNLAALSAGSVVQKTFLSVDGQAGSYANCGALPSALPDAMTLMCWVNLKSTSTQALVDLHDSNGVDRVTLTLNQNQPTLIYWGKSYTYVPAYSSDGTYYPDLTPGHWHHLAVVIDTADRATFYIDGQFQSRAELDGLQSFSGSLHVGGASSSPSLSGKITGVSVWASALTQAQVAKLMNANPATGGLPSGVACLGYWVFDPASPTNLMKPGGPKVQFSGGASAQEDPAPVEETYLYFSSVEPAAVFLVSNTLPDQWPAGWVAPPDTNPQEVVNEQISARLDTLVMKGAVSLGTSASSEPADDDSDDASPIPTLIQFITETAQSGDQGDWPGPDELLMLVMMDNAIPPDIDDKTTFADDSAMQVPATGNLVVGMSDEFLFGLIAAKAIEKGDQATVGTDPVDLVITTDKARLTLEVANGQGLSAALHAQFGLLSRDVWNIDASFLLTVTLTTSNGVTYRQLGITDVEASVLANQSSATVISFEVIVPLLAALVPELALLCVLLAEAWQAVLYFEILNKLTSKTFDPVQVGSGRLELTQIAFEDGVLAYGFLNAQGPTITALSVTSGAPGTPVTISGTSFVDSQGASLLSEVWIGGQSADFSHVQGTGADGSVVASVPLGGTGVPTPVKVRNTSGLWSNAFGSFTVLGTVAPNNVFVVDASGVGGDSIRISGQGFTGTTAVQIAGKAAAGFTVVSDTSLTAVVPSLPQSGPVSVTNNLAVATSTNTFEVIGPPTVTDSTPSGKPGETITITGTGFIVRTDQPVQVLFSRDVSGKSQTNGVEAQGTESQITVVVPQGAVPAYLWVKTAAGTSGPWPFKVESTAAPTVGSFSPAYGKPLDQIQVNGQHFTGAITVLIGTQSCSFVLDADDGDARMVVTVGSKATDGAIKVQNSVGDGSSAESFEIISKPTISGFSPSEGKPGVEVTVNGTGFVNDKGQSVVEQVTISGQSASVVSGSVTSSKLVALVPSGGTGIPTPIEVETAGGTSTSSQAFTVKSTAAPTILSFSPASGKGGSTVTVTGTNFTGTTHVTIGTDCVFAVVSDATLSVTVPRSLTAGPYPINVQNSGGSAQSSASFQVTA